MTYEQLMQTVHRVKLPAWYRRSLHSPKVTVLLGDEEYHELLCDLHQYWHPSVINLADDNNPSSGKFNMDGFDVIHVAMRSYQDIILSHSGTLLYNEARRAGAVRKDTTYTVALESKKDGE